MSQTNKSVFQLKIDSYKSDKYVFDNVSVTTWRRNKWYSRKPWIQFKKEFESNDKLLNLITIHERHSKSECSEKEDVQASISIHMTDMFT